MEKNAEPRYEVRGESLYVNGERQTVARRTVKVAVATAGASAPPGGEGEIPAELGRRILRLEAAQARRDLAAALLPFLAL